MRTLYCSLTADKHVKINKEQGKYNSVDLVDRQHRFCVGLIDDVVFWGK